MTPSVILTAKSLRRILNENYFKATDMLLMSDVDSELLEKKEKLVSTQKGAHGKKKR
jgi:hypothetical protein